MLTSEEREVIELLREWSADRDVSFSAKRNLRPRGEAPRHCGASNGTLAAGRRGTLRSNPTVRVSRVTHQRRVLLTVVSAIEGRQQLPAFCRELLDVSMR